MTGVFVSGLTGLAVLVIVLVMWLPRRWRRTTPSETAEDWLRLRTQELEEEPDILLQEAALRLVEEGIEPPSPNLSRGAYLSVRWSLALLAAVCVLSAALYWRLGSWEDVGIADALTQIAASEPQEVEALVLRITRRAEQRPDNADYAFLLSEYYLTGNDPARALVYLDRLIDAGSESPEIFGKAAQAEFLSSDRRLSGRAAARAQQALALNPAQPAALATLGMAAFEAEDFAAALEYWGRLRALETPGMPGYEMLTQVMARARAEMAAVDPAEASPETGSVGTIAVVVEAPAGVAVDPQAIVFVFARPGASQTGMPVAVARTTARSWPLSLRLDDGNSMAGQKLSSLTTATVEVQVSGNGQPGREHARFVGGPVEVPVGDPEPVVIALSGPAADN